MQCIYNVVLVSGVQQSDSVVRRHGRACAWSLSCVQLFATPWTVACQAPLSMGFSRKEYWSGLPCPSPAGLSDSGMEPMTLVSPALADGFFTTSTTWEAHCTPAL